MLLCHILLFDFEDVLPFLHVTCKPINDVESGSQFCCSEGFNAAEQGYTVTSATIPDMMGEHSSQWD